MLWHHMNYIPVQSLQSIEQLSYKLAGGMRHGVCFVVKVFKLLPMVIWTCISFIYCSNYECEICSMGPREFFIIFFMTIIFCKIYHQVPKIHNKCPILWNIYFFSEKHWYQHFVMRKLFKYVNIRYLYLNYFEASVFTLFWGVCFYSILRRLFLSDRWGTSLMLRWSPRTMSCLSASLILSQPMKTWRSFFQDLDPSKGYS